MSDERLDRSQESFDLKKAVLVGFIKSRFWITAKRIEPHAVVGRIIFLGTLLYFGLSLGMLYLHHRLPETEYFIATLGLLGLLGSWYVLQQNLGRLRRVWENKIAYGLVASLIGVCCKVLTDQQIRELTQSDPSLFPSAQAAITVLNIVEVTLSLIGGVIVLSAMLQLCKENFIAYGRKFLSIFSLTEMLGISSRPCTFRVAESFCAKIWGGFFFIYSAFSYQRRGRRQTSQPYGTLPRRLVVYFKRSGPRGFGSRLHKSAVPHSRISVQYKRPDPKQSGCRTADKHRRG